jgi:hypothetical protein
MKPTAPAPAEVERFTAPVPPARLRAAGRRALVILPAGCASGEDEQPADAAAADRRRGAEAGPRAHIVKSELDQRQLLATLRTLVGRGT